MSEQVPVLELIGKNRMYSVNEKEKKIQSRVGKGMLEQVIMGVGMG